MKASLGLKISRIKAGLTQHALGTRIGVREETVSRWETQREDLTEKRLYQLADILGVKPKDIRC